MSPGARNGKAIPGIDYDAAAARRALLGPGRCDAACPAEARVQVIRSPDRQLSFCQHHFREPTLALIVSGWQQIG
jgi:hypothetical protein